MTDYLLAALGVLGTLGTAAVGDMVSEEVRDRLDHVPQAILRLAARRLDPEQRATIYEEVGLADLAYFLPGDEARPVTRLITGTWFAIGILVNARRIERNLSSAAQYQATSRDADDSLLFGGPDLVGPDGSAVVVKYYRHSGARGYKPRRDRNQLSLFDIGDLDARLRDDPRDGGLNLADLLSIPGDQGPQLAAHG